MDNHHFIANIEWLLEKDPGSLDLATQLRDIPEWDSLAFVSFLAMADSKYSVKVAPSELRQCKTIGELAKLLEK